MTKKIKDLAIQCGAWTRLNYDRHLSKLHFVLGVLMLTGGIIGLSVADASSSSSFSADPIEFNDYYIRRAVCALYALIEGAFGALIMTVAGIGAIVSSAFGAYRSAVSLIVVACGSFILRSLVSLFFGPVAPGCGHGDAGNIYVKVPPPPDGAAVIVPHDPGATPTGPYVVSPGYGGTPPSNGGGPADSDLLAPIS